MDRFRVQGRLAPEADLFLVSRVGSAAPLAMKQVRCGALAVANAALQTAFSVKGCNHPSIVKYHEIFLHQDGDTFSVCLVMDLFDERDLSRLLQRAKLDAPLPLATVLRVAVQVCDALRCLHRNGLVHGALKPTNVLLADNAEKAVLTDVRLLKDSGASGMAGTTAYIAPEQARGAYGPKADVWALGCLLLEMLVPTWRNKVTYMEACLLGDDDFQADIDRRMKQQDCWPLRLISLVRRLLRLKPDDRDDLTAALAELSDLQDGLTVPGPGPRATFRQQTVTTLSSLDSLDTAELFGTHVLDTERPLTPASDGYPGGTVPANRVAPGAFDRFRDERPIPVVQPIAKRVFPPVAPAAPAFRRAEPPPPPAKKLTPIPSAQPVPSAAPAKSPSWGLASPSPTPWAAPSAPAPLPPQFSSASAQMERHSSFHGLQPSAPLSWPLDSAFPNSSAAPLPT
eukprot:EG_transcript_12549